MRSVRGEGGEEEEKGEEEEEEGEEGEIWKEVTPEKASLRLSLINFSCKLILFGVKGR